MSELKCSHCHIEFYGKNNTKFLGTDPSGGWAIYYYNCPNCKMMNIFLVNGQVDPNGRELALPWETTSIRPRGISHPPCPEEVTKSLAEDYSEACLVLVDSPKASAALSRRCLQNLLREGANVKPGNLADEIQQVIDSGNLPSHLAGVIDAVRNIGNFAAYPNKSKSTGEIVSIMPEEAEWNLDVLEALFDFYYVQPAIIARKRATLDQKLKDAGQKPMK